MVIVPIIALMLSGCANYQPRVLVYEDYSIIIADPHTVNVNCGAGTGYWDNGVHRRFNENVAGCWKESSREIWARWDRPEVLTHELAHKAGIDDPKEEGYDWQ